MKTIDRYTHQYKISKTLRFNLQPVLNPGQTTEEFWNRYINGADDDTLHQLYMDDNNRHDSYPLMKAILDQWHREFIDTVLAGYTNDWRELADAYINKSDDYSTIQDKMRVSIRKSFESHAWWKYLSSDFQSLFSCVLPNMVDNTDFIANVQSANPKMDATREKMLDTIKSFNNFTTFFDSFKLNRINIYSSQAQTTAIGNRVVNENFPKFIDNIKVYERLKEICPDELKNVEKSLSGYLDGKTLDDIFKPEYYNYCLTQKDIEIYNWIIGGNPNENVLGINSIGNEYIQKHPECNLRLRDLKMSKLYKQILSDRVRLAFLPEQFESDDELMQSVSDFFASVESTDMLAHIKDTMSLIKSVDTNKIYVQGSNLTRLSSLMFGGSNWNLLGEKLRASMVNAKTKKGKAELSDEIGNWLSKKCFSVAQIESVSAELIDEFPGSMSVKEIISDLIIQKKNAENIWEKTSLIDICQQAADDFRDLKNEYDAGLSINTEDVKTRLKTILDCYMNFLRILEIVKLGNKADYLDKDDFYRDYSALFDSDDNIYNIIPLYNKVRNYLTRKLEENRGMTLKFGTPSRANGWEDCSILSKDGKYYLMMMIGKLSNSEKSELYSSGNDTTIFLLKQQKTDFKNLVRCFFSSKKDTIAPAVSLYNLPIHTVKALYDAKKNSKDPKKFYEEHPDYTSKMIDYLKIGILRHKSYAEYRSKFTEWKKTEDYSSIQEFCNHTQTMCYSVITKNVSFEHILKLQNEDKVLLFEIANRDMSEYSNGKPNLHTMYWNELFSEENLRDTIYKMSSQGVKFSFRKAITDKKPYMHKKGSVLVNKTLSDGTPIQNSTYVKFQQFFNGQLDIELSSNEKQMLSNVIVKPATYDIVKNKRYYEHKFFINLPIEINYNVANETPTLNQFNKRILDDLRNNKRDLNIIGIDRGERNLIYVSVINQHGENLITPQSFNLIDNGKTRFDYLSRLKDIKQSRDNAKKNWTAIEKIKDMKNGYLSQVIHEITRLMVKYNAIVVLEDLNRPFIQSRNAEVEYQVYQNFEKMLMDKLNFLVFKNTEKNECGSVRDGLQLTVPTTFEKLGKQNGWMFYVPAEYTSKIDPVTGFCNLFNNMKTDDEIRKFFSSFDEITYKNGMFYFTFDYRNFKTHRTDYKNVWTLSSHGKRISHSQLIDLTEEFRNFFDTVGIPYTDVSVKTISELSVSKIKDLYRIVKLMLNLRNSNSNEDFIISPVASERPFNSAEENVMDIHDADANGAYNIALKGLYMVHNDFPVNENGYIEAVRDEDWFKFIQSKPYQC